ncbi:OB-fold-containig protein [Bacteroides sp. 519]|uniref:OB-fold-containig protein n=1 Tax=Bacteroides sp. 519 TaxID=2302937 RepID=UPI0013D522F1|nr:OB-fold-containig protein [Bacteroides sp. 519]NDV58922.1 DUF1449 family protein [Bacteroides sp. 519]
MSEFFYNLMHPLPNAVMTVIMGVLALYWLFTLLSGAGMDDLDLGLNFDVDVDADVDADIDADTDADSDSSLDTDEPGFFMKFLNFMNVGRVPFMLVLSTLKFFTWIGSLITTQLVNVTTWGAWSLLILLPLLFLAVFFTRWTTNPLVKLFKEIGYRGEEAIDFLGRRGKMISSIQGDKVGCAEVVVDKNPIRLNVRSIDGETISYGDPIIIADETDDQKIYLVSKEISIRNF